MKTSNKLLLGFVGVLFAGMLTCNFILKAEYERIKTEKIATDEFRTLSKNPFKYIRVDGRNAAIESRVSIEFATNYEISSLQEIEKFAKIRFNGDTLLVNFEKIPDSVEVDGGKLFIKCPSLQLVDLQGMDGYVSGFKLTNLAVILKGSGEFRIFSSQIDNLTIEESDNSSCDLNSDLHSQIEDNNVTQSYINHLKLTLKDKSSFNADDIPFKTIDPIVGDSANISLSGASLRPLLKRNVQQ
ncbi:hypothetical protein QNI19_15745 [Cytophagaceae bacterium DM2B3-1]|uniref:Auto-transporter adhesin head GIN domain-containing protein n=1 Tax=Xanthocytophaga flava TaxID=3048013 RepID=A0ABT7CL18_9BACT|nr:hypothetical protein [Xanthocytophaga flavus]MDJ1469885.1 hypothetical protein [Xanthocytophaga flavus]MDJ1494397.1 hypothetical protein [Xanthocytophaga flavus]